VRSDRKLAGKRNQQMRPAHQHLRFCSLFMLLLLLLLLLFSQMRQGLDKMFTGLDPSKMASGIASAQQGGLDAARLLERFHASPSLSQRMTNPRVLAALMDMAR
jgi:hypothetical protein